MCHEWGLAERVSRGVAHLPFIPNIIQQVIHFYHVSKRFDRYRTALSDVSFQLDKGEFAFLTGPSGAGKSTLLKLILKQFDPTEGQIIVNGRNLATVKGRSLPFFRRGIGMVFQDFKLIDRMSVFENLAFVMTVIGVRRKEQRERAYRVLRQVGLQHRLNALPQQLSGGEQQRVALARALVNDPEVLIADEPTGNLDPELSREIIEIFVEANLRGSTILVATHDPSLIRHTGRRQLRLDDGHLVEQHTTRREPAQEQQTPFMADR